MGDKLLKELGLTSEQLDRLLIEDTDNARHNRNRKDAHIVIKKGSYTTTRRKRKEAA